MSARVSSASQGVKRGWAESHLDSEDSGDPDSDEECQDRSPPPPTPVPGPVELEAGCTEDNYQDWSARQGWGTELQRVKCPACGCRFGSKVVQGMEHQARVDRQVESLFTHCLHEAQVNLPLHKHIGWLIAGLGLIVEPKVNVQQLKQWPSYEGYCHFGERLYNLRQGGAELSTESSGFLKRYLDDAAKGVFKRPRPRRCPNGERLLGLQEKGAELSALDSNFLEEYLADLAKGFFRGPGKRR
jgi:hypothetical protein